MLRNEEMGGGEIGSDIGGGVGENGSRGRSWRTVVASVVLVRAPEIVLEYQWANTGPPLASRSRAPSRFAIAGCSDDANCQLTLLSVKQPFCILVFGLDQELATKWHYNWSPGLILGAFCIIFRA